MLKLMVELTIPVEYDASTVYVVAGIMEEKFGVPVIEPVALFMTKGLGNAGVIVYTVLIG